MRAPHTQAARLKIASQPWLDAPTSSSFVPPLSRALAARRIPPMRAPARRPSEW